MAVERGRPTLIRSVQRALRLIEVVGEREGRATAKEIARATGLPLATAYHLLRTCTYEGWLQRLDDGTYVLGHRLDTVHRRGRDAAGIALARPALEWLRDAAGGPVYLARCVDGEIVVVEIVDGPEDPADRPLRRCARRSARDGAGQVHPRPVHDGRARRLPVPASDVRPDPAHRRGPTPADAACSRTRSPSTRRSTRWGSTAWLRPSSTRTTWRRSGWWSRRPRARAADPARRWSSAPGGCPARSSSLRLASAPLVTI